MTTTAVSDRPTTQQSPFWHVRVGDVRIVYWVDEAEHAIVVLRVARRNESTYSRVR